MCSRLFDDSVGGTLGVPRRRFSFVGVWGEEATKKNILDCVAGSWPGPGHEPTEKQPAETRQRVIGQCQGKDRAAGGFICKKVVRTGLE